MGSLTPDAGESSPLSTSTVRETVAQVRFALNQLAARNGQFEFEALSRALARQTVSRNILPATGPVAAGGDQGRDFETFTSYLVGNIQSLGRRMGLAEGEGLAFACTLQSDGLVRKIESDVAKIVGDGTAVDHVVYYCEANLPVARRHQVQGRVREKYSIHLEIFDGEAIAELLAQRELHWIAQEHLRVSMGAIPPTPDHPEWYEADRARWRSDDHLPSTYGDLIDLAGCIRLATRYEPARIDLPFWFERIGSLLRDGLPEPIRQKARFELAVAHLRGLGDLRPVDHLVAEYLDGAATADDPSELIDASTLLTYCVAARTRNITTHSADQIQLWNAAVQARCLALLAETTLPGRTCELHEALGWLRTQPNLAEAEASGLAVHAEPETILIDAAEMGQLIDAGDIAPTDLPTTDLEGAFDSWERIVDLLPSAPLFPVEPFAEMLVVLGPILMNDPRYDAVVAAVDERVAEVVGGDAAASHARDRAMRYRSRGLELDALREFHRARMGWLSGEAHEALTLASLMTSQIYRDLHMPAAAKHVALGAARIAGRALPEQYAWACFKAAEADYHQAAWFGSTQVTRTGLAAHYLLAEDAHNLDRHSHLGHVFFELAVVRGIAQAAGGHYGDFVQGTLDEVGGAQFLDDLLDLAPNRPWWENATPDSLYEQAADDLGHPPFSDGGRHRTIRWRALGVSWAVEFENNYTSTVLGERLAAYAQVVLVDLAEHDPVLLPTSVTFRVFPTDADAPADLRSRSDGSGTTWLVRLPVAGVDSPESVKKITFDTLTAIMSAVADITLLEQPSLAAIFTEVTDNGLLDKLAFGTAYDFAYGDLISASRFEQAPRSTCSPLAGTGPPASPHEAPELRADDPGPGYDLAVSTKLIEKRYRMCTSVLVATLPALQANQAFRSLAMRLKDEGWKDWHILLSILNVAQNHRVQATTKSLETDQAEIKRLLETPEASNDPAPVSIFSEMALRNALETSWLATLSGNGLHLHQQVPDLAAIGRLLASRYSYWDHDIEHEPYF